MTARSPHFYGFEWGTGGDEKDRRDNQVKSIVTIPNRQRLGKSFHFPRGEACGRIPINAH